MTESISRIQILKEALNTRKKDVLYHDINIKNYRLAIQRIDSHYANNSDLQEFRDRLDHLLGSSILEKTKEEIMIGVIEEQIKELES